MSMNKVAYKLLPGLVKYVETMKINVRRNSYNCYKQYVRVHTINIM